MSYVGSSAAVIPVGFSGVNSQSFNGDGSTVAFTLNRPVSAVNAIEVMVNNVQQSPYDGSYSVSSTTLTFSAAPSSGTANIYVVYRDFPVGSITDTGAVQKTGDTMTGNLIVNTNVGIRTSSPGASLDVRGGGNNSTPAEIAVFARPDAAVRAVIENGVSTGNGISFGTTTGHPLVFRTADTERATITSEGNVGVGTSSPTNKLTIVQAKATTSAESYNLMRLSLSGTRALNDTVGIRFGATNSTTDIGAISCISGADNALYGTLTFATRRYTTDSLDEAMRIDNRGRVTMPYQPMFYAQHNSSVGSSSGNYGRFDNEYVNVGGHASHGTHGGSYTYTRWYAPVTGKYLVWVGNIGPASNTTQRTYVVRNGSDVSAEMRTAQTGNHGTSASMLVLVSASAGDWIAARSVSDDGALGFYNGVYAHFGVQLIG